MGKPGINNCFAIIVFMFAVFMTSEISEAKGFSVSPPKNPVKLIFIHHSCGENWLSDSNGGLGKALGKNNYFVSDTNYGWGPSNIGDRTDIVNWPEWFAGSKTATYMKALLNENKKHSSYTRKMQDPGGRNRIVMFKSCFPNSELRGNPDDPSKNGAGLTVGNAKAIYIKLLSYFSKHPETLFIAVTAPPVQDRKFSRNARAFNNWLVYEWLKNYKGANAGVYDFFNTLTGPDNHHRVNKNSVEHVYNMSRNTLYYAESGDDHPLSGGNRKAVNEFVPLLNLFYNNWQNKVPYKAPIQKVIGKSSNAVKNERALTENAGKSKASSVKERQSNIADFENGCSKWEVFCDENPGTKIQFKCTKKNKSKALRVEYKVSNEGWGTCSLVYPSPVSWKKRKGISFDIMSEDIGKKIDFIVYQGKAPNDLHHFEYPVKTNEKMQDNWQTIMIPFKKLRRPSWEGRQNDRVDLRFVQGVAVGFDGENNRKKSRIWIDNIKLY